MWSACFCVTKSGPARVENFLGFIGINLRVGHVKWYSNFDIFDATLKKMYRIFANDKFFPTFTMTQQSDRQKALLLKAKGKSGSDAVKNKMEVPEPTDDDGYWDQRDHSFEELLVKQFSKKSMLVAMCSSRCIQ